MSEIRYVKVCVPISKDKPQAVKEYFINNKINNLNKMMCASAGDTGESEREAFKIAECTRFQ